MTEAADARTSVAVLASLPTEEFVAGIEAAAVRFDAATYPQRELPARDWAALTGAGVLLPVLPVEYGGRGSHVEMCRVVEVLAERNLAVAVHTAIVTGLALRPVVRWAGEETKREVLPLFAAPVAPTAGFASTEPGCGSAMSGLTTTFEEVEGGYRIRGRKHWQALSATASWWVVVAKRDRDGGREYGWFVVERGDGFRTSERYEALGLKVIDYGVNDIDAIVPAHRRIDVGAGDLSSMVDIYLSGRALISALACGFLRRLAREARAYADARRVGRSPLSAIGFVRHRLEAVDAAHTVCAALDHYVRTRLDLTADLTPAFPCIQAVKIVATELMVSSANHYQQLAGGEGYRNGSPTNIAAQAFLDSRVFTVFDGTNDLLGQQLAQHCLDRSPGRSLSAFLADWEPTAPAVPAHGLDLRFLDRELAQEHLVLAGRAIAYTFAAARVLQWARESGADADRARRAAAFLRADIDRVRVEFDLLDDLAPGS
ncbi:Acyl-CoA dehydrogenase [Streptomyces sp. TLI_053]|uniref:acyl-CoA dehydrogenase family protein n=1 Tax=Streptomyces sp. TLI_053 TaxID=1855352 RepID=UPI00087B0B38|nr:acyl-CoA dehydrogenase family protein [Streptomyces sp. TLI_053]SDS63669.1 Acyl-CoA dehydrogenase [Streptomyces sp. TLI_053]